MYCQADPFLIQHLPVVSIIIFQDPGEMILKMLSHTFTEFTWGAVLKNGYQFLVRFVSFSFGNAFQ
jgi:hypothetical protein